MWRTLFGWLVVAHGLLTIVIWAPDPKSLDAPMDTSHSWLLGDVRAVSLVTAIVAGAVVAAAGGGFLAHQAWWPAAGFIGGALSLAPFGLFFTRGGPPPSRSVRGWSWRRSGPFDAVEVMT